MLWRVMVNALNYRSRIVNRLPAFAISHKDVGQIVHTHTNTCACVTKQGNCAEVGALFTTVLI